MKRIYKALMLLPFAMLCAWVTVAQTTSPSIVHGPFPLERDLESALDIGFEGWEPVATQVIPEGCMGYGYKTWLVIYNSGNTNSRVSIVASGENCYFTTMPFLVKAHQRRTYDAERYFMEYIQGDRTTPDVSFQVLSDTPGVYAQVTMVKDGMGYTSQGFFK